MREFIAAQGCADWFALAFVVALLVLLGLELCWIYLELHKGE